MSRLRVVIYRAKVTKNRTDKVTPWRFRCGCGIHIHTDTFDRMFRVAIPNHQWEHHSQGGVA